MKFPDGSSYDGEWCQGLMDGSGKYIWDNGNYYHGNYSKGKRNGKGTMFFYKANLIYHGFWIDGEPRQ
jgi:1-phosphatidylinositol-4-phosphate 5-kinase